LRKVTLAKTDVLMASRRMQPLHRFEKHRFSARVE